MKPAPGSTRPAVILACLLATWFIWGSTYYAIRLALPSVPPFVQTGTRFVTAGGLLLLWNRVVRRQPWPSGVEWRNAWLVGTLMLARARGTTSRP
ncbi:MAG: hypothetical protein KGI67_00020 [Pseudomonadota bacterium]|nr:hypothetical protein [Pseudomonadota bacterium]